VTEFQTILALLLAAVLLAGFARRIGIPYPALLAMGGAGLAFVPGAPALRLEPDLALALLVAPVLLDASFDASPRDLRENWASLVGLVAVLVVVTTAAVAWVAHAMVPGLPWAAAIALGAAVAPPDAAAATAVLRQVNLPHRLVTILEGESLLNDATALIIFRIAAAAAMASAFSSSQIAPAFVLSVVGSVVVGPVLGTLTLRLLNVLEDAPSAIVMQFVTTFGVWILAERLGLSPILTMVCYGITVSRRAPELTPARLRIPSYAVWETVVFILNVMAFVLIGLQVRPILESLEPATRTNYLYVAVAVLITVIVVRVVWVMLFSEVRRWKIAHYGFHPPRPMAPPSIRGSLLVAWSGMRGVVTLAAALALPTGGPGGGQGGGPGSGGFPFRDLIVLTAFCVVLGTLVIQGLTIKPLLRLLKLRDDDPVGREATAARCRALAASLAALEGEQSPAADSVRQEYQNLLGTPATRSGQAAAPPTALDELRLRALGAARRVVSEMRASDEIGDDAFHVVEEELDWAEMNSTRR
jgi:CPA1 family monovalent cation:H+ antiporter